MEFIKLNSNDFNSLFKWGPKHGAVGLWKIFWQLFAENISYLEHILIEQLFVIFTEFLEYDITELGKVDEAISDDVVGKIDALLLLPIRKSTLRSY